MFSHSVSFTCFLCRTTDLHSSLEKKSKLRCHILVFVTLQYFSSHNGLSVELTCILRQALYLNLNILLMTHKVAHEISVKGRKAELKSLIFFSVFGR